MKTNTYKIALKSNYRGNKKLNTVEKYRPIGIRREIQSNKYANCKEIQTNRYAEKYRQCQIFLDVKYLSFESQYLFISNICLMMCSTCFLKELNQ